MAATRTVRRPAPSRRRRAGPARGDWSGVVALPRRSSSPRSSARAATAASRRRPAPAPAGVPRVSARRGVHLPHPARVVHRLQHGRVRGSSSRRAPPAASPTSAPRPVLGQPTAPSARPPRPVSLRDGLSRDARRHRRRASPPSTAQGALREHRRAGHRVAVLDRHARGRLRGRRGRGVRRLHAHDAVVPVPVSRTGSAGCGRDMPWWGPRLVRKWERRVALSLELGAKAAYGWLIGLGSQAAYGAEDLTTFGRIRRVDATRPGGSRRPAGALEPIRCRSWRCRATRRSRRPCSGRWSTGVRFQDIAGNDDVVVGTARPRSGVTCRW